MPTPVILSDLPKYTREAVRFYWQTRAQQLEKQRKAGGSDQGPRNAVIGGAQMDGFIISISQRDFIVQPRVATTQEGLRWVTRSKRSLP